MDSKKLLVSCIVIIVCVVAISAFVIGENGKSERINSSYQANNTTGKVNVASDSSSSVSNSESSSSSDPDYEPDRDDSHKYATPENPVTVQQSDGEYVYYGPGHFDYYGGDNHMSGEYYEYRKYHG